MRHPRTPTPGSRATRLRALLISVGAILAATLKRIKNRGNELKDLLQGREITEIANSNYTNLQSEAVNLDLAVTGGPSSCSITLSWTDASGRARTVTTNETISPGASTTVGAGVAITGTSTGSGVIEFNQWQIGRVDPSKMW